MTTIPNKEVDTNTLVLEEIRKLRDDIAKQDAYWSTEASDKLQQVYRVYSFDTNVATTGGPQKLMTEVDFPDRRATSILVITAGGATAGDAALYFNGQTNDAIDLYALGAKYVAIPFNLRSIYYSVTNIHAGTAYIMVMAAI